MARRIIQISAIALQIWALFCIIYGIASPLAPFLAAPILVLSHQFLTVFHEAGHAIVARAVGWRVIVFTVRPVSWRSRYRDLTWLPLRRGENAGFISTVPWNEASASPQRYALLVLAGPLANLLLGAIFIWGSTSWTGRFDRDTFGASLIAFGLGIQSIAMCIANLSPRGNSDGALLLRYWRGEHPRPGLDALGWINRLMAHRERLRDYPAWMIERARRTEPPPKDLAMALDAIEVGVILDGAVVDPARARDALDRFRAKHGASEWLDSCDAYFTAQRENDAVRARATLWRGARTDDVRAMAAAAEAAVAAIEGDRATATARLGDMRAALKAASPYRCLTFRDIGHQIETLIAQHDRVTTGTPRHAAVPERATVTLPPEHAGVATLS